jgi:secondary thiamine-phosphate synthase enzyme
MNTFLNESAALAYQPLVQYCESFELQMDGPGLRDIGVEVHDIVRRSGLELGLCTIFLPHTSCSLLIQENADEAVRFDLQHWMNDLAPRSTQWTHTLEGSDDMPSHARSTLGRTSETIPIREGRLVLGRWQALYLWEHRDKPRLRTVTVHLLGAPGRDEL